MKNLKKLIIITGPSGVGKGTVVKELLNRDKDIWLSISATTRKPRVGEKDGENYYFISDERFKDMINKLINTSIFSIEVLPQVGCFSRHSFLIHVHTRVFDPH